MENNFDKMEEDKRHKLINSGYKEFSMHGVARSSLNKILKNADLSKGFFYHYFQDKNEFLDCLITYGIRQILDKLNNESLLEDPDFIRRLQKSATYKNELTKIHPDIMKFFTKMYRDNDSTRLKELSESLSGDFAKRVLVENIDYSFFREDVSIETAMKIISRYINQLSVEIEAMIHNMDFEDISHYYEQELEDLKSIIYRKGTKQ